MTTYAVTGASGPFGHHAVTSLIEAGVLASDIVALVRTPSKVQDLADQGVQVRAADYSDAATLPDALAGVDTLLLVSGSEVGQRVPQHTNVIDAAKAAGVSRIAYTSAPRADTTELALAPEHKATEEALRASGIAFTILRNGWYIENYLGQVEQYRATGEIVGAAGDGLVSGAPRADFAEAAAAALVQSGHENAVYELGGAPAFTMTDLAAALSTATGTTIVYRDVTPDELVATLEGVGLDSGTAGFVTALDVATKRGDLFTDSGDLQRLLGRESTPLADAIAAALK
ncbi:SDR family oxidoreductase [Agreia sp. Leaf283]|uniref:SDR family oxidoreductase n=1 Tax=Agreia sp. Leaf283 TaxID=1736321 RepID=UPI000701E7D3|nr:SDR family oxidoreductase [Agreia sp. Leaf283]KQP56590.1 NAD(P)-dependent oxidoreductase [Agreia sp. Leaf283]